MARIMAEQIFKQPLTDEQSAAMAKRLDSCLEVRNGAWRRSSVAIDRLRMVCEFEAPDAESVRQAFRASETAYERIWPAEVYAVEDYPDQMKKLQELLGEKAPAPPPAPGGAPTG